MRPGPDERPRLRDLLHRDKPPVLLDGALATELEARGHDLSDDLWSARLLRDDPGAIAAVHRAYLEAGAQVLITASYQASVTGFTRLGEDADTAADLIRRSVELAKQARDATRPDALIAASVGPYGAVLAEGQEYTGDYGATTHDELKTFHAQRLELLLDAEPDCIACETIPRQDEAAILARVLDETSAPDAWIAFSCRDGRRTSHGEPIEEAIAAATSSSRVVAVGINCTKPEYVEELLQRAATVTDLPLVAYPNSGRTWDGARRAWTDTGATTLPQAAVRTWIDAGARLIGGCCGLGPTAIERLAEAIDP